MDILETIKYDKVVVEAMSYDVCPTCGVVDQDSYLTVVGVPCKVCKTPSEGGHAFFDVSILSIIELVQESFCAIPEATKKLGRYPVEPVRAHTGATIVFFCTLKELLLDRFLDSLAHVQGLSQAVIDRLQADNDSHSRRLTRLFPALVGVSWEDALQTLDPHDRGKYDDLNAFLKNITDERNLFLGADWNLSKPLADDCIRSLFPVLNLFVALHNKYIHALLLRQCAP